MLVSSLVVYAYYGITEMHVRPRLHCLHACISLLCALLAINLLPPLARSCSDRQWTVNWKQPKRLPFFLIHHCTSYHPFYHTSRDRIRVSESTTRSRDTPLNPPNYQNQAPTENAIHEIPNGQSPLPSSLGKRPEKR